jgi:hypothetical protein
MAFFPSHVGAVAVSTEKRHPPLGDEGAGWRLENLPSVSFHSQRLDALILVLRDDHLVLAPDPEVPPSHLTVSNGSLLKNLTNVAMFRSLPWKSSIRLPR